MNAEQLALQSAKEKFAVSIEAANPKNIISCKPLGSVGVAFLVGVLLVVSGKRLGKTLFPGPQLIASVLKRLL